MGNVDKKLVEKFDNDFHKIASQDGWNPEDITLMKDLQKIMYYIEVRCAMSEGEDYQDDEYMGEPEYGNRSYGNRYYNGGYGTGRYGYARGMNSRGSGRRGYNSYNPYNGSNSSGRRYYDGDEKENSMNDLRQMIQMEQDPEKRSMLENIMHTLEKDK